MEEIIGWLNGYVWGSYLVYTFLGLGLMYSVLTRFLQFRLFKDMIKFAFDKEGSAEGISSFQAMAISLGSRVGTGNIAGVATAISLGGPGAIFWMWVAAILGSATSFIEITLTQIYKRKINGQYRGGTPYYIEYALNKKWLAIISAILTMSVMSFLWPGVQANTVALSMNGAFGFPTYAIGIVITGLLAVIIFGGIKRIAKVAEYIVPFMAVAYLIVCLIILAFNIHEVPRAFSLIVSSAFNFDSTFGGIVGSAIALGVQRGVFSNGAGIGSETFESGAAGVSHPAKQGLAQAFSVYIDTLILCTATALMILVTNMYDVKPSGMTPIIQRLGDVEPTLYTQLAVDSVIPNFGKAFLAISLFFFCFTTLISYYYKAETNLAFLLKNRQTKSKWPSICLKLLLLLAVMYGSTNSATIVWALGDLGLGVMAWINLVVVLLLTKPALIVLKDYEVQRNAGKNPYFNSYDTPIPGADLWVGNKIRQKVELDLHFKQKTEPDSA